MKVVKNIIQYILTAILALAVLALILINIVSSHILNEDYILSKLEEENYYNSIYEDAKSNFEKYIYQSGLDENVLNNILTKEKIEKDTKIIISNIFDGIDEEISTEEIANNLNQNIKNSIGGKISSTEQKSIDVFVDTICKEYKSTISHTQYESKINTIYKKIINYISIAKKVLLIFIGICIILICLLTMKRIYRIIARLGTVFTIDGLLLIIAQKYINSKVRIEGITVLNDVTSKVLRNILNETLDKVIEYGGILLILGIILIITYGLIKSIRKLKREKEQYTPEN